MQSLKRSLPPLALALISLAGCATERSEPAVNRCALLPLVAYSPADQGRVAGEVDGAAPGAAWPGWVADYGALRAAVRACAAVP